MQYKGFDWKSSIWRGTREELSLAGSNSNRDKYEVHPGADSVNK